MKIVFMFPGQGTQKIGMAKDIYDEFADFREFFGAVSDWSGIDLRKLVFEENDDLAKTECTQLAILSVELGILGIIEKNGFRPYASAGYSLGEYAALRCAGCISDEDAIRLIMRRGKLMAEAVPNGVGGMAAVIGLDFSRIEEILSAYPSVSIVNYNTSSQVSVAGLREEVEKAAEDMRSAGARKVVMLKVAGPFHSSLLKGASAEFLKYAGGFEFRAPSAPYYPNVTGKAKNDSGGIADLLSAQISSPVRWLQGAEAFAADGVDSAVEIGPGHVLKGFLKEFPQIAVHGTDNVSELRETLDFLKTAGDMA